MSRTSVVVAASAVATRTSTRRPPRALMGRPPAYHPPGDDLQARVECVPNRIRPAVRVAPGTTPSRCLRSTEHATAYAAAVAKGRGRPWRRSRPRRSYALNRGALSSLDVFRVPVRHRPAEEAG